MISNVQPKKIIYSSDNINNKLDIIWISQHLLDYVPVYWTMSAVCSESGRNVCSQFSKVEALVFNRMNLSTQDCSVPLQHVEIGFPSPWFACGGGGIISSSSWAGGGVSSSSWAGGGFSSWASSWISSRAGSWISSKTGCFLDRYSSLHC